ncbi:MAG: hypothetical protein BMS9Abin23_1064 [Thermodesulfobacteriota bacterium]|nr:MAG: hypothetical protein BMS9Abin23_1064 [Thermodesulfobacteriota bacterium]
MKKSFTRIALLLAIITVLYGCSKAVNYKITERFYVRTPLTVAVLPVYWDAGRNDKAKEIGRLFRSMSLERLRDRNYRPLSLADVDERLSRLDQAGLKKKTPGELARILGADAVLSIRIKEWKQDRFLTYAYLKIKTRFELYSLDSTRLWYADYGTKDSDIKMDKTPLEISILKVYEPRIERLVAAVFSTLPLRRTDQNAEKFYDWLP